ncbi:hypothetical protein AAFF_G00342600 [Aldrovandia affinis]|uniref:Uncharacterized protein n=1 Tax=Aldrovandia affinis TaxID=143900 RepID=A0AAD7R656_9TELE|nr:hypothetical protein AAFF_G00342600 [Aldrovandia affinis]
MNKLNDIFIKFVSSVKPLCVHQGESVTLLYPAFAQVFIGLMLASSMGLIPLGALYALWKKRRQGAEAVDNTVHLRGTLRLWGDPGPPETVGGP